MNFPKRLITLFLFATIFSVPTQAQKKSETAIRKILTEQTAAWNTGDIESFMNGYWKNDSLLFIGKKGPTYGYQATLDNYKKGYPDKTAMGKLSFNILHVNKLCKKYYSVIGKWHLERTIGNLEGHFTLLVKKIKGQWVIVSDHSS